MYVYIKSERAGQGGADNDLFTVGFYLPEGRFVSESDWATREEAAVRVNYLNGGIGLFVKGSLDADKLMRLLGLG